MEAGARMPGQGGGGRKRRHDRGQGSRRMDWARDGCRTWPFELPIRPFGCAAAGPFGCAAAGGVTLQTDVQRVHAGPPGGAASAPRGSDGGNVRGCVDAGPSFGRKAYHYFVMVRAGMVSRDPACPDMAPPGRAPNSPPTVKVGGKPPCAPASNAESQSPPRDNATPYSNISRFHAACASVPEPPVAAAGQGSDDLRSLHLPCSMCPFRAVVLVNSAPHFGQ
jgi:hypothetical protein